VPKEAFQKGLAELFIEAIQEDPERVAIAIDEAWRKMKSS
jgi:phenylpyruvate tautomerase PptA (4-oxalocrotonate tautomerase family)